ncbi:MFS-type transporter SLC18B1 isoform X2 [Strongylocentrotus purpuratus]|uniref:Major facilitator superfamily (MFS) profile domain-containing protein n=1 Tax=Strongylocentrotus purpuratus TaxID=7668 RepID=A0A7M7N3N1_STRPU|nr:MFS-type transporter SLC18B1 isoform X2 [Strongylocentrotus purpuratus]
MDLQIQQDETFPVQSAMTGGSGQYDEILTDQSSSRASPGESGHGLDQSEDSAKDFYRFSENVNQTSAKSVCSKDIDGLSFTYENNQQSDYVTGPHEESPENVHLHDSAVTEQTEVISSDDSTCSPSITSPLISDESRTSIQDTNQSRTSIQDTNQSEDSSSRLDSGINQSEDSSSRFDSGINQVEHNGDGSNSSYQRDERSKSASEEDEVLKEPSKLTKSQVLIFISLAVSIFLDQASFSVLAPFFPREAKEKGVSGLQIGFIFGAFALVNVIFSPIFGKFLPRLGAKFTFVSGVWIVAGCNILFGFCDEIKSTSTFVIFCYVTRCTAAVGTAAGVTATYTIAAQTFPDHVAQTVGLMETFGGLGYMVGPVIGGFLYEVGGNDGTKTGSITKFLSIPSVWPVGLSIFVGSASFGFLDPTLSLHVAQFTESAMVVGLLFLLSGGCYALSSPLWGWMAEKLNISRLMIIIGTIMSGGAFLLMGPSPLLNLPNELWIICVSLALCGIFLSASVICSFNDYLISASNHGFPDDMSTQAVVSGIFTSLLALGNFVGPSLGGLVVHLYSFDWSVTVIGGIQVVVAIIVALFTLSEFCCQNRRRPTPLPTRVMASVNEEDLVQDSMEPLLKGHV